MSIRESVPWQAKMIAKIVLSRLPLPYSLWRRVHIFRDGAMDNVEYAQSVLAQRLKLPASVVPRSGTWLELGPGDSLASALLARRLGADRVILIDGAPHARMDVEWYRMVARTLDPGATLFQPHRWRHLKDVLLDVGAEYFTDGLRSLKRVASATVRFSWSQAVLEHIRRAEFDDVLRELRRVLLDDGISSHRIDLRDHLSGGLQNLRFSHSVWESRFFASSGFYTNRLRFSEIVEAARRTGFDPIVVQRDQFEALPLSRAAMHPAFRGFSDDDLTTSGFDLMLAPV